MPRPINEVTTEQLLDAVKRYVETWYPRRLAVRLRIDLDDGDKLRLPVPAVNRSQRSARPACSHSPDFRSANWFGQDYSFSGPQAAAVRLLWQAWEDGAPDVGQETLLEAAGTNGSRLRDVFKDHPAWGSLIVTVSRGTYRLAEPG